MAKTDIAKKEETSVALISAQDLAADAQLGGRVELADIGIPFVYILQGLSPQVDPASPKYIEGAQQSMIYISVIEKVFDGRKTGIDIVPCYYERLFVEWTPRDKGGGFKESYEPHHPIVNTTKPNPLGKGAPVLPNGNLLEETAYHYCLVRMDGRWVQTIFPWKSTFLKHSRKLNSAIETTYIPNTDPPMRAPRWMHVWNCKSQVEVKNDNRYNVPLMTKGEMTISAESRELYDAAKQYAGIAANGILRKALAADQQAHESGANGSGKLDDEVPF